MEYRLEKCVWEITTACNLNCLHCGSGCGKGREEELTLYEMEKLCAQFAEMKVHSVGITGGEPFLKKEWREVVKILHEYRQEYGIICNGTMIDGETARYLYQNKPQMTAVSIDGNREVHNRIRRKDCFDQCMQGLRILKEEGLTIGVITSISQWNFECLEEMYELLEGQALDVWKLQLCFPMGNMEQAKEEMLNRRQVKELIDFAYRKSRQGRMAIDLADNIGYYTWEEIMISRRFHEEGRPSVWKGCNAGVRSVGILSNGDVVGCTAIRDRRFVEGNLRKRGLREIWEDERAFAWRRGMTAEMLKGYCKKCRYGKECLGGCSNMRLLTEGSVYGENRWCVGWDI